jgi:RHS repeat-associated protein
VGGLLWVNDYAKHNAVVTDGNGNVMSLWDSGSRTNTATYEYGPFGESLRQTGSLAKGNPFRFSSKYQDHHTEHYYYGFRFYNAVTGRWLSRDPIEELGGLNLYGMVNNDVVNGADYLGLSPCDKIKKKLLEKQKEISRLADKIATIKKDIQKRLGELAEDSQGLPWTIPGQPVSQNPATTRAGHEMLINVLKMHRDKHAGELQRLGVELAALQCEYAACVKAEKKAATSLGKKCVKFVCRKTPIAIILFGCDAAQGGVCHAANEFVWPISEVWTSGLLDSPDGRIESYAGPEYGP